jgi:hypothetical protein
MNALTGRQLALIIAGMLTAALVALGVHALASAPSATPDRGEEGSPWHAVESSSSVRSATTTVPVSSLPKTSDPIAYARAVAAALFEWDTSTGLLPTDYTAPVLADADPTGEESPGLLTDVATFVPSTDQWLSLARMEVAQALTIHSATVPESWTDALAQARGQLRPGTSAVTVTGIRSRTGTWDGEPAQTLSDVSFTVFVACPPAFSRCHVLRLSQLNNPLR